MAEVAEEIVDAVEEEVEEIEEEEEEFVAAGVTEVKLFGKWSFDDIEIRDISLEVSQIVGFTPMYSCYASDIAAVLLCLVCRSSVPLIQNIASPL